MLLELSDARVQALQNNRELKVAEVEIERAKSRLRWSGRLPNPELEIGGSSDFIGLREDEGSFEIAFAQSFPVTSRLRNERNVRRVEVVLAEAEIIEKRRAILSDVEKAAIELLTLQKQINYRREQVDLNVEIIRFLDSGAKVGEISPLDVAQAKLNGKVLEREIANTQAEIDRAKLVFRKVVGVEPSWPVELVETLALPSSAPPNFISVSKVLERRPDYGAVLIKSDLTKAELILARNSQWDDIGVKLFLGNEWVSDDPTGLERNTLVGVGVTIPLPLRNKNEEAIDAAGINVKKAARMKESLRFSISSELAAALQDRTSAFKLAAEASGEILTLAKKNLEDYRRAYEKGLANFLEVQRAQEQLLEIRNSAIELQKEFFLSDAMVRYVTAAYPELEMAPGGQTKGK